MSCPALPVGEWYVWGVVIYHHHARTSINTLLHLIERDYSCVFACTCVHAHPCVCTCVGPLICCLSFVFFSLRSYRKDSSELPVSHNASWSLSGCTRGKEVKPLSYHSVCYLLYFLPPFYFPDLSLSAAWKWNFTTQLFFFSVVNLHVWEQWGDPLCDIEPCSSLCRVGARSSRHMIDGRSGWAGLNFRRCGQVCSESHRRMHGWLTQMYPRVTLHWILCSHSVSVFCMEIIDPSGYSAAILIKVQLTSDYNLPEVRIQKFLGLYWGCYNTKFSNLTRKMAPAALFAYRLTSITSHLWSFVPYATLNSQCHFSFCYFQQKPGRKANLVQC